ncbi:alpha/beta fold hydrolase [Pelomonas sp. SE-A7]|uniref:S9 family peptidase n=1 Tax=Pelomonas sp. SE-A7 TaxID=3054953 RepID=UPI00259CD235|nr:alpha/beta fold hydrolase [Pelomonas sp. SE-A7]MDM4765808.1 prolyl oligopeptidase family serine peptidase [Pelomonas sp. SE-A7]
MSAFFNRCGALAAVVSVASSLLAPVARAEERPQVPLETFFAPATLTEPSLSPSGDKLAVLFHKAGAKSALLVLDLTKGGKASRIAQFADGDIVSLHWVNDRRLIFGVSNVESDWVPQPRLQGMPGLYAVNADGSELLQLVRRNRYQLAGENEAGEKGIAPMISGVSVRLLKVPAARDGEVNEDVLLAVVSNNGQLSPFWLNTRTRTHSFDNFGLTTPASRFFVDSQGQPRLAVVEDAGGVGRLMHRPSSDTTWGPLLSVRAEESHAEITAIDGKGVIYARRYVGADRHATLAKLQFQGSRYQLATVVDVPGFDFVGSVIANTGSGDTEGVRVIHAREATIWKSQQMRAFQAAVDQQLPGLVNRIDCRRCGAPDMVALVTSFSDHDPGRLRVHRAGAERPEDRWLDLGRLLPAVEPGRMASVSFHRIQARDGRDLPVWITRPDQATGPLPAVVLVHGGPWVRGGHWLWKPLQQFLASRGYLVIEPEMRGSLGYGLAHHEAGFKQYGQAMQDDVADALLWAQQAGLADDRACIAGSSYGGYSALMGTVRHPGLYRCVVARAAVADLSLYVEGSFWIRDDISEVAREQDLAKMVGDPRTDAAMIAANSPVKLADRIKVPVLLAYGEADKRVPLAHGKRMRSALKDAGNPPEWVSYPDEVHDSWTLASQLDFARRMEAFLARHLAPR